MLRMSKLLKKPLNSFSWIFCFVYHYFKLTAFRLHVPTVCPRSPPNSNNFQGVFLLEFAILCNSRMLSSLNLGKTLLKRTRILAAPTSLLSTAELGYKRRPQEGQLSSQQLNFAIVASSVPRLPVCIRSEKTYNLKQSFLYLKKKLFVKMASRIRLNFHSESEALINKQINMELHASYCYMAMVSWPQISRKSFNDIICTDFWLICVR